MLAVVRLGKINGSEQPLRHSTSSSQRNEISILFRSSLCILSFIRFTFFRFWHCFVFVLCGDTAERSRRRRQIHNAFSPFRALVCVLSASFSRCLISCDILCWPGICIVEQEPPSTTTIHANFVSTEGRSNAHFGIQASGSLFSGWLWHRKSRDKRSRMKETTSTNATDAVLQAHCLHHIYGHFQYIYSVIIFFHRLRRCHFPSALDAACVCATRVHCVLETRMTTTGNG